MRVLASSDTTISGRRTPASGYNKGDREQSGFGHNIAHNWWGGNFDTGEPSRQPFLMGGTYEWSGPILRP